MCLSPTYSQDGAVYSFGRYKFSLGSQRLIGPLA